MGCFCVFVFLCFRGGATNLSSHPQILKKKSIPKQPLKESLYASSKAGIYKVQNDESQDNDPKKTDHDFEDFEKQP